MDPPETMEPLETMEPPETEPSKRSGSATVLLILYIILVLGDGTEIKFALPEDQLKRKRERVRAISGYLNGSQYQITRTALMSAARSFTIPNTPPVIVYTSLPGVPERVFEFLTGKPMSGPRNYETDPWGMEYPSVRSNAKWPQLLFTLALLHALFEAGMEFPKYNYYMSKKQFYTNLNKGKIRRSAGYAQTLRVLVSNVPLLPHTLQKTFMLVMYGVPPFNTSGFDQTMVVFVEKLRQNPDFIKGMQLIEDSLIERAQLQTERLAKKLAKQTERLARRQAKQLAKQTTPEYIEMKNTWDAIILMKREYRAAKAVKKAAKAAKTEAKMAAKMAAEKASD